MSWEMILAPALAALIGSGAGATLALHRFKKERAFDAQLAWYTDMVRANWAAAHGLQRYADALEGEWPDAGEILKEALEAVTNAVEQSVEVWLFGRPKAAEIIWLARVGIDGALKRDHTGQTPEKVAADYRSMASTLLLATRALSMEGRNHLDLDPLDTDVIDALEDEVRA